jgi:hypothetical protein
VCSAGSRGTALREVASPDARACERSPVLGLGREERPRGQRLRRSLSAWRRQERGSVCLGWKPSWCPGPRAVESVEASRPFGDASH